MRTLLLPLLLLSIGCSSTVARRTDQLAGRYEMYGFTGAVLVAQHDRVVLDRNYGVKERAFDVGSIMKTVVAAAVMELQRDGKLQVSDLIGRYIDGLPADRAAITIHELLLHTSGLPLDDRNMNVPLGEKKYSYSNVGYGLLAQIVERAAGKPFREYARERLLDPAGMRETSFWGEPSLPTAPPFTGNSDEELTPAEPLTSSGKYVFGAGGLITTTRDLHRWWRFVDARPGTFIEHIDGQAYGWNVRRQPDGSLRHYRGGLIRASYMSMLSAYRAHDTVLIWMMNKNTGWHGPLTKNFERILAGQPYLLPPAVVRGRDDVKPEYIAPNARLAITRDGDDLLVAAEGQQALSIVWALDSNERAAAMSAEVAKKDPAYEILGTGGHSISTDYLQTFVRSGGEILRFISDGKQIVATGKGYPRSAQRRFRRTGAGTYALYDQRRDAVVTLTFRGDQAVLNGAMTLNAPRPALPSPSSPRR